MQDWFASTIQVAGRLLIESQILWAVINLKVVTSCSCHHVLEHNGFSGCAVTTHHNINLWSLAAPVTFTVLRQSYESSDSLLMSRKCATNAHLPLASNIFSVLMCLFNWKWPGCSCGFIDQGSIFPKNWLHLKIHWLHSFCSNIQACAFRDNCLSQYIRWSVDMHVY